MGLQYIKKYLLKGTQEKIPDTMVETVLCFHPHCTIKRRGVKPEDKWFAWATFEMEDSEVEWLRNLLSADTVIMRFEGTDYSKFDYTWTVQDRQAITDIIDLYNLLKAVTPEVREKALRN